MRKKLFDKICILCKKDFQTLEPRNKFCSKKCGKEIMRTQKLGEQNPQWKGDKVKYSGLHLWIKTRKSKPEFCEECKEKPPYDLANISQKYKRDITDFEWLCRSCHMAKDGRLKILALNRKNKQFCPKKHPYNEENTYVYKNSRYCKTCNRERNKIFYRNEIIRHNI